MLYIYSTEYSVRPCHLHLHLHLSSPSLPTLSSSPSISQFLPSQPIPRLYPWLLIHIIIVLHILNMHLNILYTLSSTLWYLLPYTLSTFPAPVSSSLLSRLGESSVRYLLNLLKVLPFVPNPYAHVLTGICLRTALAYRPNCTNTVINFSHRYMGIG